MEGSVLRIHSGGLEGMISYEQKTTKEGNKFADI